MPPQININDLYSMQKNKSKNRIACFDIILQLSHNRIKTVASHNGQNTFYEIPGFMIGYPLYNLQEALEYIVSSLRKNGFLVQLLPEPHVAVVYISWDPDELKPSKPLKQLRPRADNMYNQQLLMNNRYQPTNIHTTTNHSANLNTNTYEKLKTTFQSSLEYTNQPQFNIPLLKSSSPIDFGTPKTENTRPVKIEPFYLSNLRLF